jgi:hypothetical protein
LLGETVLDANGQNLMTAIGFFPQENIEFWDCFWANTRQCMPDAVHVISDNDKGVNFTILLSFEGLN